MDRFQPALGQRVKARRKQLGMTQGELAGRDLTKSAISQIECGKLVPSLKTLGLIATRLDVRISFLLGEEAPPNNTRLGNDATAWMDKPLRRKTLLSLRKVSPFRPDGFPQRLPPTHQGL